MPNWVATFIQFEGKQENISKVFKAIEGDNGDGEQRIFDFNKLIPMPESLNITVGSKSELAHAYYMAKKFSRLPEKSLMKLFKQSYIRKDDLYGIPKNNSCRF